MKINNTQIATGFAVVGIRSSRDLAGAAELLGRALNGLVFDSAEAGMFDEYPAYVAYSDVMRFALLGPSEDDGPDSGYQLLVEPLAREDMDSAPDISGVLVELISKSGHLDSWVVE